MFFSSLLCGIGSGLCDELITPSEDTSLTYVCLYTTVCDLETSAVRMLRPNLGCSAIEKKQIK